jgi:hypothetical protein
MIMKFTGINLFRRVHIDYHFFMVLFYLTLLKPLFKQMTITETAMVYCIVRNINKIFLNIDVKKYRSILHFL